MRLASSSNFADEAILPSTEAALVLTPADAPAQEELILLISALPS